MFKDEVDALAALLKTECEASSPVAQISEQSIVGIFEFLIPVELIHASEVCTTWRRCGMNSKLWLAACENCWTRWDSSATLKALASDPQLAFRMRLDVDKQAVELISREIAKGIVTASEECSKLMLALGPDALEPLLRVCGGCSFGGVFEGALHCAEIDAQVAVKVEKRDGETLKETAEKEMMTMKATKRGMHKISGRHVLLSYSGENLKGERWEVKDTEGEFLGLSTPGVSLKPAELKMVDELAIAVNMSSTIIPLWSKLVKHNLLRRPESRKTRKAPATAAAKRESSESSESERGAACFDKHYNMEISIEHRYGAEVPLELGLLLMAKAQKKDINVAKVISELDALGNRARRALEAEEERLRRREIMGGGTPAKRVSEVLARQWDAEWKEWKGEESSGESSSRGNNRPPPRLLTLEQALCVVNELFYLEGAKGGPSADLSESENMGFRGNTEDYYNPANSMVDSVLHRRLGIPISLSAVYSATCHRAGIAFPGALYPVGMPGHFILGALRHTRAPGAGAIVPPQGEWWGESADGSGPKKFADVYIDVFNEGKLLSVSDCAHIIARVQVPDPGSPEYVKPTPQNEVWMRCLRNLINTYQNRTQIRALSTVLEQAIAIHRARLAIPVVGTGTSAIHSAAQSKQEYTQQHFVLVQVVAMLAQQGAERPGLLQKALHDAPSFYNGFSTRGVDHEHVSMFRTFHDKLIGFMAART
jgi:regulator of sirC expression with transglutaminase-like and TPR domain